MFFRSQPLCALSSHSLVSYEALPTRPSPHTLTLRPQLPAFSSRWFARIRLTRSHTRAGFSKACRPASCCSVRVFFRRESLEVEAIGGTRVFEGLSPSPCGDIDTPSTFSSSEGFLLPPTHLIDFSLNSPPFRNLLRIVRNHLVFVMSWVVDQCLFCIPSVPTFFEPHLRSFDRPCQTFLSQWN